jgi:hypothetical protein
MTKPLFTKPACGKLSPLRGKHRDPRTGYAEILKAAKDTAARLDWQAPRSRPNNQGEPRNASAPAKG